MKREVHDFLYGEGEHPFQPDTPFSVRMGFGTEKDAFEPNFDRPRAGWDELKEGIIKEHFEYDPDAPPQY